MLARHLVVVHLARWTSCRVATCLCRARRAQCFVVATRLVVLAELCRLWQALVFLARAALCRCAAALARVRRAAMCRSVLRMALRVALCRSPRVRLRLVRAVTCRFLAVPHRVVRVALFVSLWAPVLAVQEVTFHSQLVRARQIRRLVALFVLAADSRKVLAVVYRSAVVLVVAHCC